MLTGTEFEQWADSYRSQQALVAGTAANKVARAWRSTEVGDRDSERSFVSTATSLVLDSRRLSRQLLQEAWLQQGQMLELPELELLPLPLEESADEIERIERSLAFSGPARAAKHVLLGETPEGARETLVGSVQGTAMRHTGNLARETMKDEIEAIEGYRGAKVGWLRVTAPYSPCYFCVALASRGPVYRENSFRAANARFKGDGEAKAHDHCRCAIVLVREGAMNNLPQSDYYRDLWRDLSGNGSLKEFRKNYDAFLKSHGGSLPR